MSESDPSPDRKPVDRRAFFRHLLLRGFTQVEKRTKAIEQRLSEAARRSGIGEGPMAEQPPAPRVGRAEGTVPRGQPPGGERDSGPSPLRGEVR